MYNSERVKSEIEQKLKTLISMPGFESYWCDEKGKKIIDYAIDCNYGSVVTSILLKRPFISVHDIKLFDFLRQSRANTTAPAPEEINKSVDQQRLLDSLLGAIDKQIAATSPQLDNQQNRSEDTTVAGEVDNRVGSRYNTNGLNALGMVTAGNQTRASTPSLSGQNSSPQNSGRRRGRTGSFNDGVSM